jgi:hypothetical protein
MLRYSCLYHNTYHNYSILLNILGEQNIYIHIVKYFFAREYYLTNLYTFEYILSRIYSVSDLRTRDDQQFLFFVSSDYYFSLYHFQKQRRWCKKQ